MRLAAALPLPALHAAGWLLGWLMYLASPRYARRLRANLTAAGYSGSRLRRRAIAEAGKMLTELPLVWLRPRAKLLRLVRAIDGEALVEAARDAKLGIVFITPHLGCFEITAQVAAERFPITVLYRVPKIAGLQPFIEAGRAQENVRLAAADLSGVRELLAALKRHEAVGILPDQVPMEGEGEWAEFFGRPAYTMTLASKLASRPNTAAFLAFGERLPWGRGYKIHLRALPPALPGESRIRRLNRALEALIRTRPEQYLWAYNRYKAPEHAQLLQVSDAGTAQVPPAGAPDAPPLT